MDEVQKRSNSEYYELGSIRSTLSFTVEPRLPAAQPLDRPRCRHLHRPYLCWIWGSHDNDCQGYALLRLQAWKLSHARWACFCRFLGQLTPRTLNMEEVCSSETSGSPQTTPSHKRRERTAQDLVRLLESPLMNLNAIRLNSYSRHPSWGINKVSKEIEARRSNHLTKAMTQKGLSSMMIMMIYNWSW
jgi:hypothetical protein